MSVRSEIEALEEQLRLAELAPDPDFFEKVIDDKMTMLSETGEPVMPKAKIVEAHRPGKGPKFTRVEMSAMTIIEHENAAVVTCKGEFEGPMGVVNLKFMRIWLRTPGGWKIVAGSIAG